MPWTSVPVFESDLVTFLEVVEEDLPIFLGDFFAVYVRVDLIAQLQTSAVHVGRADDGEVIV